MLQNQELVTNVFYSTKKCSEFVHDIQWYGVINLATNTIRKLFLVALLIMGKSGFASKKRFLLLILSVSGMCPIIVYKTSESLFKDVYTN